MIGKQREMDVRRPAIEDRNSADAVPSPVGLLAVLGSCWKSHIHAAGAAGSPAAGRGGSATVGAAGSAAGGAACGTRGAVGGMVSQGDGGGRSKHVPGLSFTFLSLFNSCFQPELLSLLMFGIFIYIRPS